MSRVSTHTLSREELLKHLDTDDTSFLVTRHCIFPAGERDLGLLIDTLGVKPGWWGRDLLSYLPVVVFDALGELFGDDRAFEMLDDYSLFKLWGMKDLQRTIRESAYNPGCEDFNALLDSRLDPAVLNTVYDAVRIGYGSMPDSLSGFMSLIDRIGWVYVVLYPDAPQYAVLLVSDRYEGVLDTFCQALDANGSWHWHAPG